MKFKRIVAPIIAVLLISTMFAGLTSCKKSASKNNEINIENISNKLQNCKQALIPTQGTISVYESGFNQTVNLHLTIVDKFKKSNFTKDNIKKISFTGLPKNVEILNWYLSDTVNDQNHWEKSLDVVLNLPSPLKSTIDELCVEFKDGTSKSFDIGDLSICYYDKNTLSSEIDDAATSFIRDRKNQAVTGAVMYIISDGNSLTLNNIDTGINGIYADYSRVKIFNRKIDINEISQAMDNDEDWVNVFNKTITTAKPTTPQSYELKALKKGDFYTVFIPFVFTEDIDNENTSFAFSLQLHCQNKNSGSSYIFVNQIIDEVEKASFANRSTFADIFDKYGN